MDRTALSCNLGENGAVGIISFIHSFIDMHKAAEKIQKHNKNST